MNFAPKLILGQWRKGYALDWQTISSQFMGYDEFGHPRFDTKRSEIGELLYQLKYRRDTGVVANIVAAAVAFLERWKPPIDIMVPVPPSTRRAIQPVLALANAFSEGLGVPLVDCLTRVRDIPELKNISDLDERLRLWRACTQSIRHPSTVEAFSCLTTCIGLARP